MTLQEVAQSTEDVLQGEQALPRWATITQVSEALAIPRNAVRSAVRRAVAGAEVWVKKRTMDGTSVYLIDTQHPSYLAHEARWKQGMTAREHLASWLAASHTYVASMWRKEQGRCDGEKPVGSRGSSLRHEQGADRFHAGPRLWRWLSARGLEIFTNCLTLGEQAHPWQWHWNELHGTGYANAEEALLAALQHRFEAYERERDELSTALFQALSREEGEPALEEEPNEPAWVRFFSRKSRSRS